jgi:tetratricopeptide (TPR) repeat protein
MAVLEGLAAGPGVMRGPVIVVIVGAGGLGKTSLASHWLHGASGRYPDGSLFAELGDAERPTDVLAGFLRALGVAPDSIPVTASQQAALFRSVTTGRKMAIFLDNAASASQVRLLLPGPGPELDAGPGPGGQQSWPSLVLVTTRWRLAGLAVDGARFLEIDPFGEPEARELLGRIAGEDRVTAEADASREVARLCGGSPLAVCVCAARLAAHPQWPVSRIARELATERSRLSALSLAGDLSVRAAFDTSYQALPPRAARAYRMAALIPGADFCADLAAAVLDDQEEQTQELLDVLTDASLLTEGPAGRYRMHDLARLHAREQAGPDQPGEREAAVARSVTWYLQETVTADRVVLPGRWRLGPLYEQAVGTGSAHGSPAEALDWLEGHLPGILAAVRAAHDAGLHQQAWQLCEALWGVLLFRKHYTAWQSSHEVGLLSARACGDGCAEAQMDIQLGAVHRSLGRIDVATLHFSRALELFRAADHRLGEASALSQLGVIELRSACYSDAISHFEQARDIHLSIGRRRGVALMNFNIGQALAASGRQDEAIGQLRMAEGQFAAIDERYQRARALAALGGALIGARQALEAAEPLRKALAMTEELGSSYDRAHVHVRLADLGEALGQHERATEHLEQALALFTGLSAPQAEGVRARLARALGHPAHESTGPVPHRGSSQ